MECLERLKLAEMSGKQIELPCGFSSGLLGAGMRTNEIQRILDNKVKELKELVVLYGLDEHTLPK